MDREGQTTTAGRALAERLGRVGLWTRQLDIQPAERARTTIAELEGLGWGSLWSWEVFGREALTNAGLLLCATQRMVIGTGIANMWARDPWPWPPPSEPLPRPTRAALCSGSG
jgi:alkanesulfonate monooxygenase SsuD/methylene tetrahydromethanopterin reductase-like flavin-dependent oxidoreductase (luciferase family)